MRCCPIKHQVAPSQTSSYFTMSNISDSHYALRTRELNKLITQLRALGAQAEVELPRIAVIGNQSAGKSSLVEAISGITVPRSTGTCTRCPMECRLTQSSPLDTWRCQVSLRIEYDNDTGSRLPSVREHRFGPPVTDPTLLEDVLRRAQLAILNPSVDYKRFIDYDVSNLSKDDPPPLDSIKQLQFSKNVVCLDLSSPESTDLSFIDLPGIISNVADGEDRNNIDVVRNLVIEHIKGKGCLILLTLTMRDDIENQSAAFLAKEVDPQGHRTIGVLTKPDTLLAGEYGPWLEVLQNRRHSLRHGYYMTKHPSTDELSKKLSFEEARTREKDYFEDPTNPWWENDATRKRLGTRNLTASLSKLLSSLIDETLPKLREDASKSLQEARNAYSELPPPVNVTNPTAELLNMITTFSNEFHHYTAGSSNSYASMIQKYKPAFKIFKFNVRKTAPDFRPYTIQEAKDNSLGWEEVLPDDDDDEHSAALEKQQQPIPDNVLEELSVQDVDAVKTIETRLERLHPVFVDQVKTYINGSLTRELPFNVPFSAKDGLIQHSMVLWEGHALDCFKFVRAVVADHLSKLVDKHFGRFVSSGLTDAVGSVVQRIVDRYEHKTIKRIKWMLRLEQRPFTQNNHYFSAYRENYLSKYKGARRRQQQGDSGNDEEREQKMREALAKLTELGFSASSPEDLEKLSSSNSYEEELTVMAEVRAYWQVAYKRIIDVLPLSIDEDFICAIAAKTQEMMVTELGLSDTDATEKVRAYIAEDPELAEERNVVNARLKRAEEVWSSLAMFKA